MMALYSLVAVAALIVIPWIGVGALGWQTLFGIAIPYAAIALFVVGFAYRILKWSRVPVPFNITTSCGQQTSLSWVKSSPLEAPSNRVGVVVRMALEVLCFRSLLRNVKSGFVSRETFEPKMAYKTSLWLWIAALAFHYCFLVVFLRHYRFFADPTPVCLGWLEALDGFFQIGAPTVFISGFILLGALAFLLLRRLADPQLRYISLVSDYLPLFLLIAIATTGVLMRHTFLRVDIVAVKDLCMGLMRFSPEIPAQQIGSVFYIHLFLVSVLFATFPFSKLMHMGGVFLSPTRNLISASRSRRHVNPWNAPVDVHTYEEYEDEFRDKMVAAGIPVDKQPAPAEADSPKE